MQQKNFFLHLKYYRYLEHVGVFEDFKAGYRSKDVFEKWKKLDPVQLQRTKLLKDFQEKEIIDVEKEISENFDVKKIIDGHKDWIFICQKVFK